MWMFSGDYSQAKLTYDYLVRDFPTANVYWRLDCVSNRDVPGSNAVFLVSDVAISSDRLVVGVRSQPLYFWELYYHMEKYPNIVRYVNMTHAPFHQHKIIEMLQDKGEYVDIEAFPCGALYETLEQFVMCADEY